MPVGGLDLVRGPLVLGELADQPHDLGDVLGRGDADGGSRHGGEGSRVRQTAAVPPEPAAPLFHVADAAEWAQAVTAGRYERSTRGLALAEVGFVHLSTAEQWPGVLDRFYADHPGPLVLLTVDPSALDAPLRWEPAGDSGGELFPHLHGPLPVTAVTDVRPLTPVPRERG